MSTQTTTYREIDILYGCDIVTAIFHAHFTLPERDRKTARFQQQVRLDASPRPQAGKDKVEGPTEEQVLARAREKIDRYLDDKG